MAEPSYEELQQRVEDLEKLVKPYYEPPGDQEYSFPVERQGITQDQFSLISRAAGTGVYVQHGDDYAHSSYRLSELPGGETETNARNQMVLRVSEGSRQSEAVISGFFHVLAENKHIDLPAVTTTTTYYLCLTYDPRDFRSANGPISIKVYDDEPPETDGQKHIILYTVTRRPNELLSDATIEQTNPWIGHVINVWSVANLPEPTSVEYGTLAVVIRNPRAPEMYTNRGVWGWIRLNHTDWEEVTNVRSSWQLYSDSWDSHARGIPGGAQISVVLRPSTNGQGTLSNTGERLFRLPAVALPPGGRAGSNALILAWANNYDHPILFRVTSSGDVINLKTFTRKVSWLRFHGEIFYSG